VSSRTFFGELAESAEKSILSALLFDVFVRETFEAFSISKKNASEDVGFFLRGGRPEYFKVLAEREAIDRLAGMSARMIENGRGDGMSVPLSPEIATRRCGEGLLLDAIPSLRDGTSFSNAAAAAVLVGEDSVARAYAELAAGGETGRLKMKNLFSRIVRGILDGETERNNEILDEDTRTAATDVFLKGFARFGEYAEEYAGRGVCAAAVGGVLSGLKEVSDAVGSGVPARRIVAWAEKRVAEEASREECGGPVVL